MIESATIEKRLRNLDKLYLESSISLSDVDLPVLYSKVAIIELGGWVEEARDELILKLLANLFDDAEKRFDDLFRGRISGFDYERHFRQATIERLVGIHGALEIEGYLDSNKHEVFKANLGSLWKQRNSCAHRTIEGTLTQIQAPSSTIKQYKGIRDGLDDIDRAIDKLSRVKLYCD